MRFVPVKRFPTFLVVTTLAAGLFAFPIQAQSPAQSSEAQSSPAQSIDTIEPALRQRIDQIAAGVLEQRGAPSASIAVVQGGRLIYTHAYGLAHVDPSIAATPAMRYSIGSISKQFTAAAILLLQERGKLSLETRLANTCRG